MNSTITNAARIYVLEPIDYNYKTGGGPVSVGGACVTASKGKPFAPLEVVGNTDTGSNQEKLFGKPLPKKAYGMEGLRHVVEASRECNWVNVVRVVNRESYRFPSLSLLFAHELGTAWTEGTTYALGDVLTQSGGARIICAEAHTATADNGPGGSASLWLPYVGPFETDAHKWNESVVAGDGYVLTLYPIDGNASTTRTVSIETVDHDKQRFTLVLHDRDESGYDYVLEKFTVGIDPDDKDDMGRPAYIESVFESQSKYFRCDFVEGYVWADIAALLDNLESTRVKEQRFAFLGGTAGGTPETEDWLAGVDVFRNEKIPLNLFFAAGVYEPEVLSAMCELTDFRHISGFADVPPYLNSEQAIQWVRDLGLRCRHMRLYHSPYSANDPWRGGKTVWGVSGAAAAAKARGNANFTKNVPGVHYAPAGEKRGYISRTGIEQLFPTDAVNRDTYVEIRLNPVVPSDSVGIVIDDDLVLHYEENYLRFGWVNDIVDYWDHRFVESARTVKFDPDGITRNGLVRLNTEIGNDLVLSGALVKPRDPVNDGVSPFVITVEQVELDLWQVEYALCPTGAARRIAGQPLLIR